ncbi:hypothetical protein CTY88_01585 [Acinetobacter seifertii]|uniref:Uncharacterized protein n=1 Tax=Acinetobacter genomosp. 33YU TaxID=1675530 RepID=A0A1V2UT05_9GAMM|nr:hypothetical protein [Acinetobacter seifertii]ONN53100.1 hypothetical protein AC058_15275 [Acinetobacter genomosp. 33YU]
MTNASYLYEFVLILNFEQNKSLKFVLVDKAQYIVSKQNARVGNIVCLTQLVPFWSYKIQ